MKARLYFPITSVDSLKRYAKQVKKFDGHDSVAAAGEALAKYLNFDSWHQAVETIKNGTPIQDPAGVPAAPATVESSVAVPAGAKIITQQVSGVPPAPRLSLDDLFYQDEKLAFIEPGLILFLGCTAGFKTGVMSSIVANHILKYYQSTVALKTEEPPTIWGYLAEDDIATYTHRVLTNILNRNPLMTDFGFGSFRLRDFGQKIDNEPSFKEAVFKLVDTLMPNCLWMTPKRTQGKTNFSVTDILNTFETKMQAEHIRPRFIILDYLNILTLPREMAVALNRVQELATITQLLDEWARKKGVTIISAAQCLPIDGAKETDYMAFAKVERMDEDTSFANHSCMVISLLPFTEVMQGGADRWWMALQILKHPTVAKNAIFISSLNEKSNITFADSKHYSESEWIHLKKTILSKKEKIFGGAS